MPASVALLCRDPEVHELLHTLLTDAGYAVAPPGPADVALVEQVPANVRAVVLMPFEVEVLLAAVARALGG